MKKIILLLCGIIMPFLLCFSQNIAYDSLDINNINARINSNGAHFWDFVGNAKFEAPKGSGKTSVFCSTLWIGGIDTNGQLVTAADRFNQSGHDYWSGPVSNVYDSAYDARWNKTWKVLKSDVDYHKAHWWQAGYVIPQSIINWPAHGDTSLGQSKIIAPFFDNNGNGIYEPAAGDYPQIKGDMSIFFVFNDDRNLHTESSGQKLGIEIIALAYAFACQNDSALWNTIFLKYKITNRSAIKYTNAYMGVWTDIDLGYAFDDYIGSDVQRGSFYTYNGKAVDGNGETYAYGAVPPAQSVTILGGPYIDPDNLDNPKYDQNGLQLCNESINGDNFGDSINDNERYGMRKFMYYNNSSGIQGEPVTAMDYYNYLKGFWKDSTQMQWGGNAHFPGPGVCGPVCDFMFPGDSDTCLWGTGGQTPACTPMWNEQTATNQPNDRRGLGSMGPFTFEPGATHELDIAYVFGRDYANGAWASVLNMQQRIDSIRKYFVNDTTPCGGGFSAIPVVQKQEMNLHIYPNPASSVMSVELVVGAQDFVPAHASLCRVYNILGTEVFSKSFSGNKFNLDVSGLAKGLYLLKVENEGGVAVKRFVKG